MKANFSLLLILSSFIFSGHLLLAQMGQVDKETYRKKAESDAKVLKEIKALLNDPAIIVYGLGEKEIVDQAWKDKLETSEDKAFHIDEMVSIQLDNELTERQKVIIYISFLCEGEMRTWADGEIAKQKIGWIRSRMDRLIKIKKNIAESKQNIAEYDKDIAESKQNIEIAKTISKSAQRMSEQFKKAEKEHENKMKKKTLPQQKTNKKP